MQTKYGGFVDVDAEHEGCSTAVFNVFKLLWLIAVATVALIALH